MGDPESRCCDLFNNYAAPGSPDPFPRTVFVLGRFLENGGFWGGGFGAAARRGEIAFRSGRCSVGGREEGEKEGERHKED